MNVRIRRNLTAPAAAAVSTLIVLAWLAAPSLSDSADSAQDATASPAGNANPSSPPSPASAAQLPVHAVFLVRPAADPTELNMSDIQWSDGAPIYRQLKERVIAMMLDGILKPGDALPSVRQVAADYQLNPITVSRAYQELADEGLVEKRRGLGMFMTEQAATQLRSSERDRFLNEEWPAVLERIQRLGLSLDELLPQGKV